MAQMGIATGAEDFRAGHAKTDILMLNYVLGSDRLEETGPAGTGVEFGFGAEKGQVTADAGIEAGLRLIGHPAAERGLCALAACDAILFGRQLFFPLRIGFDHLFHHGYLLQPVVGI